MKVESTKIPNWLFFRAVIINSWDLLFVYNCLSKSLYITFFIIFWQLQLKRNYNSQCFSRKQRAKTNFMLRLITQFLYFVCQKPDEVGEFARINRAVSSLKYEYEWKIPLAVAWCMLKMELISVHTWYFSF